MDQESAHKRLAFDNLLSSLASNSTTGLFVGFSAGLLLCGRHKFSKYAAIGAGIGAGIAYREGAAEFNRIAHREQRVHNWVNNGQDDFNERKEKVL